MEKIVECEKKYNEYLAKEEEAAEAAAEAEENGEEVTTTAATTTAAAETTTTTTEKYYGEVTVTKYTTTAADTDTETTETEAAEESDYQKSRREYSEFVFGKLENYKAEKYQYDDTTLYVVIKGDIEERMMTILEKEGVEYDKDAVRAIISLADGGMRDALSILDQILAYSNNTLSVQDVYQIFGLISTREKVDLLKDINNGDVSRTLERINSFAEGGVDIKRLTQDILEILKDVLIYKKTKETTELTALNEKSAEDLSNSIDKFGIQNFPVKELVEFAKVLEGNSNPQCRNSAKSLFITLYKYIGEPLKNFLKDLKDATMKMLNEEFKKVTVVPISSEGKSNNFMDSLFPRVDISKKITPKMIKDLSNKGYSIVFSSHDPNHALMFDCNVVLFDGLGKIEKDEASKLITEEKLNKVYGSELKIVYSKELKRNICTYTQI